MGTLGTGLPSSQEMESAHLGCDYVGRWPSSPVLRNSFSEKEVNQLMEELFETVRDCVLCCFFSLFLLLCGCLCVFIFLCVLQFQDELTAQEQDEEGHEEEREEEAPALGKPTFSTPPDIPLVYPHIYARHIHTVLLFCYGVIFTSTLCCRRFWGQLNSISQIKFLTV